MVATDAGKHYDSRIDLSVESTYTKTLRRVGANADVLELGCATGNVSRLLADAGNRVVGVEMDAPAAARAADAHERTVVADLNVPGWSQSLAGSQFDFVIAGDVLEHLVDPDAVLQEARGLLRPGGRLIASIPNVAHGSVRLALLSGRWDYQQRGLLDRSHRWFFTRATAVALVENAGYDVVDVEAAHLPIDSPIAGVAWDRAHIPEEVLRFVTADPAATEFQFVITAVPISPRVEPPKTLQEEPEKAALTKVQAALLREADREIAALRWELDLIRNSRTWQLRQRLMKFRSFFGRR